jgi:ferredoxin
MEMFHLSGPKIVIDAIAQGKNASESLHRFVHEGASLTIGRNRREFIELDKENIVLGEYDTAKRQTAMPDSNAKPLSFKDYSGRLTEEQVKIETKRCLGCGASIVDPNKCIGCGICTTKCEFDAIHLVRDHPNASNMRRSEDKFKYILPYSAKHAFKILFKVKPEEQKKFEKDYNAYKKKVAEAKKDK